MSFDEHTDRDVIAAIATPPGMGGIAVVRVSGDGCFELVDKIFSCRGAPLRDRPSHGIVHGTVVHASGEHIDEVLALVFRAPHSYTGEHTVELQGHGGTVPAQRVLSCVLTAGARLADPGEFTKRAFLNGRLDLTQAEAVQELISARSGTAARLALHQLEGSLGRRLSQLFDDMTQTAAHLEVFMDFEEEYDLQDDNKEYIPSLDRVETELQALLDTWSYGQRVRDGLPIVISGAPNVGKSTLFNALLKRDRAIVSPWPGTTRDLIEEEFALDDWTLTLVDTAGLRESDCDIEREGIDRAHKRISQAQWHLYVLDASQPAEDLSALERLPAEKTIVVLNKSDLGQALTADNFPIFSCISTSLQTGYGIPELIQQLKLKLKSEELETGETDFAISDRHRSGLLEAAKHLKAARAILNKATPGCEALAASDIRTACRAVGHITGNVFEQELLDKVFSSFCIGK